MPRHGHSTQFTGMPRVRYSYGSAPFALEKRVRKRQCVPSSPCVRLTGEMAVWYRIYSTRNGWTRRSRKLRRNAASSFSLASSLVAHDAKPLCLEKCVARFPSGVAQTASLRRGATDPPLTSPVTPVSGSAVSLRRSLSIPLCT